MTTEQSDVLTSLNKFVSGAVEERPKEEEWLDSFCKSVLSASEFQRQSVPTRENIVGDWLKQGDLGFLFAPRGVGKTWLAMHLAMCIAEGRSVWTWDVPKSRKVLYVDGEMAFDGTKDRLTSLSKDGGGEIKILHHEQLFQATGQVLNLTERDAQKALLQFCLDEEIEILFLDNLSCLFSGIKENDADAWELVLPWLLEFRRNRIAVVFIHHAGRNGAMRGTSRREDAALWVILSSPITTVLSCSIVGCGCELISAKAKARKTSPVSITGRRTNRPSSVAIVVFPT